MAARFPTNHRTLRGRTTPLPPPKIYVSHGCLLIPAFVAAWWLYTKRWCRQRIRGLLQPETSTCGGDSEQYNDTYSRFDDPLQWYVGLVLLE